MKKIRNLLGLLLIGALLASGLLAAFAATQGEREGNNRISGQGTWTTASPMPIFRSEMPAAVLDGKIYVVGGLAGQSNQFTGTTPALFVYDAETDTWREAAKMPSSLHHLGISALEGQIYVTGGYDGEDFNPDVRATLVYRPLADRWSRAADMPASRAAHASVAIDGLLYVVGGVGPGSTALWIYDPETNLWNSSRAPLPAPREHLTAAAADHKLYVIGGRWSAGNLRTVEEYDPNTNTWTRKRDMPTARGGLTSATLDGLIHVTGGEDLGSSQTFAQHEVYDPAADTWATYPNLPTSRHGLASAAVGGNWYVIGGGLQAGGGTYSSLSNLAEVFTPEGKR